VDKTVYTIRARWADDEYPYSETTTSKTGAWLRFVSQVSNPRHTVVELLEGKRALAVFYATEPRT
jgi:hypothetical protein